MTLDESIQGLRLRVMQRAERVGNRWRRRIERYGVDGVHPRRTQGRRCRPVQVAPETERLVQSVAISAGTWGCSRIAGHLARTWQVRVAPSTVQRILRRVGLATRRARLAVLEQQAVHTVGLLTERTRRRLWRARHGRTRHVEAREPGELVCLDTFYIGSYGVAWLLPGFTATATATFLRTVLLPHYRRAGWPLQRVLTDGGSEFKGAFDEACRDLGIRHTRTKPRHAWTNGFVERLQGTILQEHWRVTFRRRYFTSRVALQRSLDGFLHFYNHDRPHQGYRLRGQPPATLFWGTVGA